MNGIDLLLTSEIVHRLGWTLVHSLWQGVLVAALLAIVLALIPRRMANARYWCNCLALFAMLTTFGATVVVIPERPAEVAAGDVYQELAAGGEPLGETLTETKSFPALAGKYSDNPAGSARNTPTDEADAPASASATPGTIASWYQRTAGFVQPAIGWLAPAWLAGVLVLSVWHLGGWIAVRRLRVMGTSPAPEHFVRALKYLADRLGLRRTVRLFQSAVVQSPMVIGWLRPVILVPAGMLDRISPAQVRAILAHELAHVIRFDYAVNLLQTAVETLLFHHPATWWVSSQIRKEREYCCDDIAVRATRDELNYAHALKSLADLRQSTPKLAAAAAGGSLFARISRVLGHTGSRTLSRNTGLAGLVVVAAFILALTDSAKSKPTVEKPVDGVAPASLEASSTDTTESAKQGSRSEASAFNTVCQGRVLDGAGSPVSGARVQVYGIEPTPAGEDAYRVHRFGKGVMSGIDGAFSADISLPALPSDGDSELVVTVVATHPDYAIGVAQWQANSGPDSALPTFELRLTTTSAIEGVVVDEAGSPIGGAAVRMIVVDHISKPSWMFLGWEPGMPLYATTDPEGRFRIEQIPAEGGGMAIVSAQGYPRTFVTRKVVTDDTWPEDFVYPGGTTDVRVVMPRESRVTGRLVNRETAEPVAGVRIFALPRLTLSFFRELGMRSAVSDENGEFALDGLPAGTVKLGVDRRYENTKWIDQPREVEVVAGQTLTGITHEISRGAIAEVVVTDAVSGRPLPKARATISPVGGSGETSNADESGVVRALLMPGTYRISHVSCKGYKHSMFDPEIKGVALVEAKLGETVRTTVALEPLHTIRGVVRGPDDRPVTNAVVCWRNWSFDTTVTDVNGRFALEDMPVRNGIDSHYLVIRHFDKQLGAIVRVEDMTKELEVRMEPATSLTGRVLDPDQQPITNAEVSLYMWTEQSGSSFALGIGVDANGRYVIPCVPRWELYRVNAESENHGADYVNALRMTSAETLVELEPIVLRPANMVVAGIVVDDIGQPVEGAHVSTNGKGQPRRVLQQTGPDGTFRLENVCEGEIGVYTTAAGHTYGRAETVAGDESIRVVLPREGAPRPATKSSSSAASKRLPVGQVAPDFAFKTLDGKSHKLSDYRGKFVLVHFWATWCGPCLGEMPQLKAVYGKFGGDARFVMIGLSLDAMLSPVENYVSDNKLEWVQGHLGDWQKTDIPAQYGVQGIPGVFLIDPDGKVAFNDLRGQRIADSVNQALSNGSANAGEASQ